MCRKRIGTQSERRGDAEDGEKEKLFHPATVKAALYRVNGTLVCVRAIMELYVICIGHGSVTERERDRESRLRHDV